MQIKLDVMNVNLDIIHQIMEIVKNVHLVSIHRILEQHNAPHVDVDMRKMVIQQDVKSVLLVNSQMVVRVKIVHHPNIQILRVHVNVLIVVLVINQ